MRKNICTVLVMLICLCVLAGCGGKDPTVESVLQQLKDAGLSITYEIVYTKDNDPNGSKAHDYIQKGNFADSNIEPQYSKAQPESGSIEIFSSNKKATKRAEYLQIFTTLDNMQSQVISGKVLLRLNNSYSKSDVEKFAKAIGGKVVTFANSAE